LPLSRRRLFGIVQLVVGVAVESVLVVVVALVAVLVQLVAVQFFVVPVVLFRVALPLVGILALTLAVCLRVWLAAAVLAGSVAFTRAIG
jgi:hypothetical protein